MQPAIAFPVDVGYYFRAMSVFEVTMLVCFGLAWPFSIYKSWKTREIGSKSFVFLLALLLGYAAGILHKIFYNLDGVVYLYALNGLMVAIDMALYLRNRLYHIRASAKLAREKHPDE